MRRGFAGADDAADFFTSILLRPCVRYEDGHLSYPTHGLPAVTVGMRVGTAQRQRIEKNELRGFKAEAVLLPVDPILRFGPNSAQARLPFVATKLSLQRESQAPP